MSTRISSIEIGKLQNDNNRREGEDNREVKNKLLKKGFAVSKIENASEDKKDDPYIYLYYTQCAKQGKKNSQNCSNYVTRYELRRE